MNKIMKKALSLLLAVVLTFSLTSVAFAANGKGVLMKGYSSTSIEDFHAAEFEGTVSKVVFLDLSVSAFPGNVNYVAEFDLSDENTIGKVTGHIVSASSMTALQDYILYIGAVGGIKAPRDCSYLFANMGIKEIEGAENFDTSETVKAKEMFRDCKFTEFNFDDFDFSSVNDVSFMFKDCMYLESVKGEKNTFSNVRDMSNMFDGCSSLVDFSLENVNLQSADKINNMFYGCESIEAIDLSTWSNTGSVVSLNAFRNCDLLKEINLSGWDLSSVTSLDGVFSFIENLTDIYLYSIKDASSCKSTSAVPVNGVADLTVHTDDIGFTDYVIWKECFGKSGNIKVAYKVCSDVETVNVTFLQSDLVEYYILKIGDKEKSIYGGSSVNLNKNTEVSVFVKAAEDANPTMLNVNGSVKEIGASFVLSEDTTVTVQKYHDDADMESDEAYDALTRFVFAMRDILSKILNILEGFFGRMVPWLDDVEQNKQ